MKLHPFLACTLLIPTLIPTLSFADDYTVEEKPFSIETTLNAVFLPAQSQAIQIKPEKWTDFTITSLVAQGSQVKKGDVIIGIDTEDLDKYIVKAEQTRQSVQLTLAQAKHDLAQLEITTPRSLKQNARSEKESAENLKWYTDIGHPREIAEATYALKRAEQSLTYIKEELKQLLTMYNEDNKIEETEEIILTRTKNGVEGTEFHLKSTRIDTENSLNTAIPRRLLSYQLSAQKAKIENTAAKENLPRALELKRLEVAQAIRDDEKAVEKLALIKTDRPMMNITAPADGVIYYGSIENGKWNPEAATKILKIGAKLPSKTTIMTFIPASSPLMLSAFTEAANLSALQAEKATGYATTALNRYQDIPVQLTHIASYPKTDGSYHVTLKPTVSTLPPLPKGLAIVPGMKATTHITSNSMAKTLKVPTDYISRADDGGYTVDVKLADGKTESRKVAVGPASKKWVVIIKGLEKGQVIVK
jgi:HlyD family secretion protein